MPAGMAIVVGAIRIASVVVLVIGLVALGLGLWTIYKGEGPLVDYLKTEQQKQTSKADAPWYQIGSGSGSAAEAEVAIQVIGGLLIGAGGVLVIDFVLGMFASSKLLAACCVPSFLAFAVVSTIIFAGCGVAALTVLEPALRTGLTAVFESDLELSIQNSAMINGPLLTAQKKFECCGPQSCGEYGLTDKKTVFLLKNCNIKCVTQPGCVDAVLSSYILTYRVAFAVGCFGVAGITTLMFIFSLILCCCNE